MKLCDACGTTNDEKAIFCIECGGSIKDNVVYEPKNGLKMINKRMDKMLDKLHGDDGWEIPVTTIPNNQTTHVQIKDEISDAIEIMKTIDRKDISVKDATEIIKHLERTIGVKKMNVFEELVQLGYSKEEAETKIRFSVLNGNDAKLLETIPQDLVEKGQEASKKEYIQAKAIYENNINAPLLTDDDIFCSHGVNTYRGNVCLKCTIFAWCKHNTTVTKLSGYEYCLICEVDMDVLRRESPKV